MTDVFWSKEHKMQFCTLSSAVSVEWNSLHADWNVSSRWLVITCFVSWTATDFLTSLEINFKFEIGRKSLNCLKSAVGFFNVGESEVISRASGIKPVVNDKLSILVIVGRSTGKQSLSTDASNSLTSSWTTSWKLFNSAALVGRGIARIFSEVRAILQNRFAHPPPKKILNYIFGYFVSLRVFFSAFEFICRVFWVHWPMHVNQLSLHKVTYFSGFVTLFC